MLNCALCVNTQYHCCKASISYNIMDTIILINKATSLNIDIKIYPSKDKANYFNITKKGKPFKSLNDENCIFLKNGKCLIYDERPNICRVYGTDQVKCWFNDYDYDTPADVIFNLSKEKIELLTTSAIEMNEKSVIELFKNKMK